MGCTVPELFPPFLTAMIARRTESVPNRRYRTGANAANPQTEIVARVVASKTGGIDCGAVLHRRRPITLTPPSRASIQALSSYAGKMLHAATSKH